MSRMGGTALIRWLHVRSSTRRSPPFLLLHLHLHRGTSLMITMGFPINLPFPNLPLPTTMLQGLTKAHMRRPCMRHSRRISIRNSSRARCIRQAPSTTTSYSSRVRCMRQATSRTSSCSSINRRHGRKACQRTLSPTDRPRNGLRHNGGKRRK